VCLLVRLQLVLQLLQQPSLLTGPSLIVKALPLQLLLYLSRMQLSLFLLYFQLSLLCRRLIQQQSQLS
jgi:hypothetical protein